MDTKCKLYYRNDTGVNNLVSHFLHFSTYELMMVKIKCFLIQYEDVQFPRARYIVFKFSEHFSTKIEVKHLHKQLRNFIYIDPCEIVVESDNDKGDKVQIYCELDDGSRFDLFLSPGNIIMFDAKLVSIPN